MKRKLLSIAAVLAAIILIPEAAHSETITQTRTFNFSPGTDANRALTFDLIDTAFGRTVLESEIVQITINAIIYQAGGQLGIENTGEDPVEVFTATWSIRGWFASEDVTLSFAGNSTSPNYSNGINYSNFEVPVGDTWLQTFSSGNSGLLGGEVSSNYYTEYLGVGTLAIRIFGAQGFNFDADGFFDQLYTSSTFSGNVTLTYEIIPEPSTMALAGLALVGVAALQRRRRLR